MEVWIHRMQANGNTSPVTLTPEAGGSGRTEGGHLNVSSVVVTTTGPVGDVFQAAASGARYEVIIRRVS